jgi:hypothetical protein
LVYLVKKQAPDAMSLFIAAWVFVAGALFLSFLAQFDIFAKADPGIFPTGLVAITKGLILLYMLTGLYLAIKSNSEMH